MNAPRSTTILYLVGGTAVAGAGLLGVHMAHERRSLEQAQSSEQQKLAAHGVRVLAARAGRTPPGRLVTLPGDVRPFRQATLYAKVSGYVKRITVDKGDRVRQGQLLATLESPETDQQVLAARANLATRRRLADRNGALVGPGVVSRQDYDQSKGDLDVATAQLGQARALEQYEVIRAPFAGVVTARYVDDGALLPAATGATASAQPLVEITDMSSVRVYVYLGQPDASFVREGTPVEITSDAHPGNSQRSSVTRIARQLDPRTRTMLTEIDLDNQDNWFYPGLFVRVTLSLVTPPALVVPSEAVFLRGGKPHVAVIAEGHAKFTPIVTGDDDGKQVRVESGLTDGQVVGLHIGDEVSDGARVEAVGIPAPSSSHR